ncbi:hypothetical protein G7Z17_g5692 [Cylindrodendrum hubeiense]|uniref:Uncharacterized protein n=1 Tax=Cylindrodendrum hubeiense TaxID=595255 RepID=A0A9P5HBB5_9HYPO|nr:hypothetical protein G7Z17_g5692 [Cylindrodendrum hubeiense]
MRRYHQQIDQQTDQHLVDGCGSPREKKIDHLQSPKPAGPESGDGKAIGQSRRANTRLGPAGASAGSSRALVSRFSSGCHRSKALGIWGRPGIHAPAAMPSLGYLQEQRDVMRSGAPRPLFLSICLSTAPAAFLPLLQT